VGSLVRLSYGTCEHLKLLVRQSSGRKQQKTGNILVVVANSPVTTYG